MLYLWDWWHDSNSVCWYLLNLLHSVYYENFAKTVASLCPDMRVFTKKAFIRCLLYVTYILIIKFTKRQLLQKWQFCLQGSLSKAPIKPSLQSEAPGTASRGFFLDHIPHSWHIFYTTSIILCRFVQDARLWFQGGWGWRGASGGGACQGGGGHLAAEGKHQGNLALSIRASQGHIKQDKNFSAPGTPGHLPAHSWLNTPTIWRLP